MGSHASHVSTGGVAGMPHPRLARPSSGELHQLHPRSTRCSITTSSPARNPRSRLSCLSSRPRGHHGKSLERPADQARELPEHGFVEAPAAMLRVIDCLAPAGHGYQSLRRHRTTPATPNYRVQSCACHGNLPASEFTSRRATQHPCTYIANPRRDMPCPVPGCPRLAGIAPTLEFTTK